MTSPLLWVTDRRPGGKEVTTKHSAVLWAAFSTVKFLLRQVP